MSVTANMLTVLMDGIKDADMLLDYADDAEKSGDGSRANWFRQHAKKRAEALDGIKDYVASEIRLDERVDEGDEIAEALQCYIDKAVCEVKQRI